MYNDCGTAYPVRAVITGPTAEEGTPCGAGEGAAKLYDMYDSERARLWELLLIIIRTFE